MTNVFIDSHVHLADDAFANDVHEVIARARANGARALVAIGETPDKAVLAKQISAQYPGVVYFTCGMHPHCAADWDQSRDPQRIRDAVNDGAVAIGECGLDFHYDNSPRDIQWQVLAEQLNLAKELSVPMVIHTRDAEEKTAEFLDNAKEMSVIGVLHCFTGTQELAMHAVRCGWFVSFSGIITFKSWTDTQLLRMIPEDRILVESDAPYLAPVPYRSKRNEPQHVAITLEKLAEFRGVSASILGEKTTLNTKRLFSLPLDI